MIRSLPSGENDRILTLLSAKQGSISVLAKGARSLKSRYMAACMPFVWGNFELHPGKGGDLFFLREGFPAETFREIGRDIVRTYLAQYICDVCCELSGPGAGAEELLSLALNSLYALSAGVAEDATVKAVFEFRAASLSGYEPDLSACRLCGKASASRFLLDVMNGGIVCQDCISHTPRPDPLSREPEVDRFGTRSILMPLTPAALEAVRYCVGAPAKRMLSFRLGDRYDRRCFEDAAETYLLSHLERGFSSLTQYRELTKSTSVLMDRAEEKVKTESE